MGTICFEDAGIKEALKRLEEAVDQDPDLRRYLERTTDKTKDSQVETVDDDLISLCDTAIVKFVNRECSDGSDLPRIEALLPQLKSELKQLDSEIAISIEHHAVVVQQMEKNLAQLEISTDTLVEQFGKVEAETMHFDDKNVNLVCSEIRTLGIAKQNLQMTINTLKKIASLSAALDQLRRLVTQREYSNGVAELVGIANQVAADLKAYPELQALLAKHENFMKELGKQLTEEYAALLDSDAEIPLDLLPVAAVVDQFGGNFKNELIASFAKGVLLPYERLFMPSASSSAAVALQTLDKRFLWLKKFLSDFSTKYERHFPAKWTIAAAVAAQYCVTTSQHLIELLGLAPDLDPSLLRSALQKTVEFEQILSTHFHGNLPGGAAEVSDLLQELEQSGRGGSVDPGLLPYMDVVDEVQKERHIPSQKNAAQFNFAGALSKAFQPFTGPIVRDEEARLWAIYSKAVQAKAEHLVENDDDDDFPNWETSVFLCQIACVPLRVMFSSAIDILAAVKNCLNRFAPLKMSFIITELHAAVKRILAEYVQYLSAYIPEAADLQQSKMATFVGRRNVAGPLNVESFCRHVHNNMAESIEYDREKEILVELKARALNSMVKFLSAGCEQHFVTIEQSDWINVAEVSDESASIAAIGNQIMWTILSAEYLHRLSQIHKDLPQQLFELTCEKFAMWIGNRHEEAIFKINGVSSHGAQQLLMETTILLRILLEAPRSVTDTKASAIYTRILRRRFTKLEFMLKALINAGDDEELRIREFLQEAPSKESRDLIKESDVEQLLNMRNRTARRPT